MRTARASKIAMQTAYAEAPWNYGALWLAVASSGMVTAVAARRAAGNGSARPGRFALRLLVPLERIDPLADPRLLGLEIGERASIGLAVIGIALTTATHAHAAAHEEHHQPHPDRAGKDEEKEERTQCGYYHRVTSLVGIQSLLQPSSISADNYFSVVHSCLPMSRSALQPSAA